MDKAEGLRVTPGASGADEVGRGALAGPVVCAAVVLPETFDPRGLNDSKKLTSVHRVIQAERIQAECQWSIVFIDAEEVDRLNVLRASLEGMSRACLDLAPLPRLLLVDGRDRPVVPGVEVEAHVKGDATFAVIAAASIIAKVARDRWMKIQDELYPGYGFGHNVGYASSDHMEALQRLGPCPIHRRSFEPIKTMVNQPRLPW
jgi:ribonuclease HII